MEATHQERVEKAFALAFEAFANTFAEAMDTYPNGDEELLVFEGEGRRMRFANGGEMQVVASNVYGFDEEEYEDEEF